MTASRLSRRGRWLAAGISATLAMSLSPMTASASPVPEPAAAAAVAPLAKHVLIFTETTQFRHDEAINQGVPLLVAALTAANISSEVANDSTGFFTTAKLDTFDSVILFNASGAPWNATEQAAFIAYQQAGGSVVGVHNATDMRSGWTWLDNLVGTLMPGHAATGTTPGPLATVRVEDNVHPSTAGLPERWQRGDEWYNYSTNVRGSAHVLATLDETTYAPGGNAMGYDHPISWCDTYDGGKVWMTGMGHYGAHFSEPNLMKHIVGGVEWASGLKKGDCGGTAVDSFEKVALDTNTSAPFGMDVLPDGRVLFTELVRGQIRVYNPISQVTSTAITIPVYSGGEDGLLGIVKANDFVTTGHIYVYYAPASTNDSSPANFFSRVSRFTMVGDTIAANTEKIIITFPAGRLPDEPGHTGGSLGMDADGNLFIGIGDDVNPHSEPSGGYAPLSYRNGTQHDARQTSANTNDLRGKLLRIHPEADGSYTIPAGNLFPVATSDPAKTKPEIYAMGFRNPFRFSIDQETGWVGLADYSPDNSNDALATRGPAGIAEWNLIKEPGNYGWPLCMGNNEPFRDVNYGTTSAGPVVVGNFFDCAAPVNNSPRNTGLINLPPAKAPDMWYGYKRSSTGAIPQGGGLAPMGGPFYEYDAALDSDTKFPEYFHRKPFFYDWARNKLFSIDLKNTPTATGSQVEKVNPFLPNESFLAPIDSKFGPDGSLYILDWGGGYGRDNPTSGLHKIDYISGSRSPSAVATATPDSGPTPLTVVFNGSDSSDPENEDLDYAWDFDGNGTTDSTEINPTHVYTTVGVYDARLTVTDPDGKEGTITKPITVGNTRPVVKFTDPIHGAFFTFGDELDWAVTATDAETTVNPANIIVQPALGHDYHAHPTTPLSGTSGTVLTSLGGHEPTENIFYALDARYTDQAQGAAPALTGSSTVLVYPKQREAEFYTSASPDVTKAESRDVQGGGSVVSAQNGGWISFDPLSLFQVDKLALRVASSTSGTIELRKDSAAGALLGTATVPSTGGLSKFTDVMVDVTDPGETFELFVVFPGAGERRLNFIEAIGKGASPVSRPTVAITAPAQNVQLAQGAMQVTASATDEDGTISSVEFFVDGTSIGTDTSAPYAATWTPTADKLYNLTAKATSSTGLTTTSRIVVAQVGELFGAFQTFSNVDGTFEALGSGRFSITSRGDNMWQGVNQYSSLYLPGGADENWVATVKIVSQGNSNASAKAGLIIRNDVTAAGTSPGYAALGIRPSAGFEWLRDAVAPAGQLDASTAASTTSYPAWVRISRKGPDYQAYWSKNGTDFTAIGGPVTLPGSASVQDIGLFVTAHSGNTSTVVFEDFTLNDNPVVVDPPTEPEAPPSCVGLRSDEFDGTTLTTSRWTTVRNATGKPITVSAGSAVLPVVVGDINEAEAGPVSYIGQPAPTGAWQVVTKVDMQHTTNWQWGGIMLHADDNNYVKLAFVRNNSGGRLIEFQHETNGARTTPAAPVVATSFPSAAYLRLTSSGTNITAAYSADGVTWTNLAGSIAVKANATIGLMAAGDTGAGDTVAKFDYFRMTPPGETPVRSVDDEFDGTTLDGCRWNNVIRYNSAKAVVAGGELRITTELGDINGTNPISPRNFILQKAPAGDWTIQTRLKANQVHRWQYAGLLAYGNDDNYVKLDIVAKNTPGTPLNLGAELATEVATVGQNRQLETADSSESGYWYLRLTKTGNSYQGWVSDGGINWTSLGAPLTGAASINSFGLVAVGPEQEIPVTIAFDYFHLVPAADTVAPVATSVVAPVAPVSGWYTGNVTVTAAATDDVTASPAIEVSVDNGAWTAYAAPVVVSTDGTHSVRVRATDAAGNVSTIVEKTFKIDKTAPAATAVAAPVAPASGWNTSDVSVTAAATDAQDATPSIEVSVNSGAWTAYTAPVVLTADGTHQVSVRATDDAGNVSNVSSVSVKIDRTAPMTAPDVTGTSTVSVALTASDATSGVASTEYRVGGGAWTAYTAAFSFSRGTADTVVQFRSTDAAGNVEVAKSVTVAGTPAELVASTTTLTVLTPSVLAGNVTRVKVTVTSTATIGAELVVIYAGDAVVGGGKLAGGTITLNLPLPVGGHELTAEYVGSATVAASVSAAADADVYFADKLPGTSFYDEILWLAASGITTGQTPTTFAPAAAVERQAMAAFLYRMSNPGQTPVACSVAPFTDVSVTSQFCGEISWLKAQGITTSLDGKFNPASPVQRQAMAAFLYRLENGTAPAPVCTVKPFSDVAVSSQFCGEIAWLKSTEITTGENGAFKPGEAVSRQAMAAFLYRLSQLQD